MKMRFAIICAALLLPNVLPPATCAVDAPPLLCRSIQKVPLRDLLLMGMLRCYDSLLIEDEAICTAEVPDPDLMRCDWRYSIREVAVLRPDSHTELRLVEVERSHMTGSGAWGAFVAFECHDGTVSQAFSREFLYGAQFENVSSTSFALLAGYWLSKDAMCCPSHRKRLLYQWESSAHQYSVAEESFFKHIAETNKNEPSEKPSSTEPWNP